MGADHQAKPISEFYVVPLEPGVSKDIVVYDQDESRPSTADIIAQQSQDYVDEKLAEYQATISLLQGKKPEKVQNTLKYPTLPKNYTQ